MQPSGHAVEHPSTYSTVRGASQPHGITMVSLTMQVGTGQRIGLQSPGCVCLLTVGQGVVVGLGGSVVIPVMTVGLGDVVEVDVEDVVVVVVVRVGLGSGRECQSLCSRQRG